MKSTIQWAFAALFLLAACLTPATDAAGAAPAPVQIPAADVATEGATDTDTDTDATREDAPASADPSAAPAAAGDWEGAIEVPDAELAILVTLTPAEDGWAGTIDIPAQGLAGFALADVTVDGSAVGFAMDGVPGRPTFAGELSDSGDAIAGTFTQGGQSLAFHLDRAAAADDAGEPATTTAAVGVPGEGPVGDWLGRLDVGPAVLRLGLEVTRGEDGSLSATLDSIDQGSVIPVDRARFEDGTLSLEIDAIGSSFQGEINDDGSALVGTWTQRGASRELTFLRQAERYSLNRPQEPREPFPYATRDVTFPGGDEGVELAGTLAVPAGEGPFPAVVFASGSGPQDRDESLMGHRPFLVIADHLARHGIASLRYDDRGFGDSSGDHFASTVDDFADDLAAALALLRRQPEVDGARVGILGHSEGGLSAAKVAAAGEPVDFLVLLAPPGVPLGELLQRQAGDIFRQRGVDEAIVERALKQQGEDLALLRQDLPRDELRRRLRERAEAWVEGLSDEEKTAMGINEQTVDQSVRQATTGWFLSLLRQDPGEYLRRVEVPVLALFGGKDLQVEAESNADAVRRALAAGADPESEAQQGHEVRILDGLNHLFQSAETGAVAEYGSIEETIAPRVLETVTAWIAQRSGNAEAPADEPVAEAGGPAGQG